MSVLVWIMVGLGVFTLVSIVTALALGWYIGRRPRLPSLPGRSS